MTFYLRALLLTIAIEVPIVAACFSKLRLRMAAVALVSTTLTHYLMHGPLRATLARSSEPILVAEIAVLFAEAAAYAALSRRDDGDLRRRILTAAVASLLANAASYTAGLYLL